MSVEPSWSVSGIWNILSSILFPWQAKMKTDVLKLKGVDKLLEARDEILETKIDNVSDKVDRVSTQVTKIDNRLDGLHENVNEIWRAVVRKP
jgi:uncharacterized protein YlxW (UPF0749 family)